MPRSFKPHSIPRDLRQRSARVRPVYVGTFSLPILTAVRIRSSKSGTVSESIARLFALVLPQALPYTIPLGVLVGTLIALSRMSADGEVTAMRAAGVPGRRVAPAVLSFAF